MFKPRLPSRRLAWACLLGSLTFGATLARGTTASPAPVVNLRAQIVRQFLARHEGTVPLSQATRGVHAFTLEVHRIQTEIAPGVRVEAWAFGFPGQAATVPGPELRVKVGERVRVTLVNTHDQPHALHLHGITSLAQEMDGVPHLSGEVLPGQSFTYEFVATEAGTFAYHCHFQTNVHLDMGMYGALIVEDPDHKPVWSQDHTLILDEWDSHHDAAKLPYQPQYDEFLVNGRAFPFIPPLKILAGETHLVRLLNVGAQPHSLHLHGTSFLVTAKDGHDLSVPYMADTLPILPGERYDVLVKGRDGTFPWHDHNSNANTTGGQYPGGMHFDVEGSPALRADGTPAPIQAHDHGHRDMSGMGSMDVSSTTASSVVTISNFEFNPEAVHIKAGGSVTWENHDAVAHEVVVTLGGQEVHRELPPHGQVTLTFPRTGTFAYHCLPHPFMTGTVAVE
ncbi:multicopper oxidase family protein [Deinococcus hopiensis]|uniref:Multicopper oxidase with three cupredoxin domains (Includes cell division protein FtsP and spore coat protein CotA) n=1 Tax=Deinococcus hopiensis KR-140 TaxID=695939 RepID=A0A1W1VW13_9DEIO|nr:multicopper oxidase domain-containing protein [Deinococcus hopiensis]SMB97559.1 Multicopper oxidase with three cupredoxin domains (includes cell division protein FtsP and spore coat protein CotA) [Deinococcus hopiensis KR-140]